MLLSELKVLCFLVFQGLFYIGVTWELYEMEMNKVSKLFYEVE
jgi:hypothetical protein